MTTMIASHFGGWVHFQRGEREAGLALIEQSHSVAKRFGMQAQAAHARNALIA